MCCMKEATQMSRADPLQVKLEIWQNHPRTIRSRTVGETGIMCMWRLECSNISKLCVHGFISVNCLCGGLLASAPVSHHSKQTLLVRVQLCTGAQECGPVSRAAAAVPLLYNDTHACSKSLCLHRKECDLLRSQTWPNPSCFLSVCVLSRCPHNTFP